MVFGPPIWTTDPVSVNEGTNYMITNMLADISNALYLATVASLSVMQKLEKVIRFILPSDVAWVIWDGDDVPDFRIPKLNYAWQRLKLPGGPEQFFRLPDVQLNGAWVEWVQGNHIIEGSMDWEFYDPETDTVKKGSEFSKPRGYSYLFDLWVDFGPILVVVALVTILFKLGLGKIATSFIQKIFRWWNRRRVIQNTDEEVAKVLQGIEGLSIQYAGTIEQVNHGMDQIVTQLDTHRDALHEIAQAIGLRFKM